MVLTVGSVVSDDSGNEYMLDENIGSGGFGNIYKAHSLNNEDVVAIKVLPSTFNSDKDYLSFKKEMNQTKLIDSPNVIKYLYIHDGDTKSNYPPYIIMEYTNGGTLRELLDKKDKQFDNLTLKKYFLQLANGMKCISEHLVHRDIKPQNILIFDDVLKITDFGLSKLSDDSTKTLTFKNWGTPLYIAPEAWNNDKNTIQMDIYSMGIVFYELATLSFPYNKPEVLKYEKIRDMHLYEGVVNPHSKNRSIPSSIASIIIKMLEKPTQKRYKNWEEIITDLESEPLPADNISKYVEKAVTLRNQKDLDRQKEQANEEKERESRENYIKSLYSQYLNNVTAPIHEFVEKFNENYAQTNMEIKETPPDSVYSRFSTDIRTPNGHIIKIDGEILFKERFRKEVNNIFRGVTFINELPQCEEKDIILWCQVKFFDEGFNILLLKNDESMYGDWFILENNYNALANEKNKNTFGFKLSDLPKNIGYLHVMHTVDMKLSDFSSEKILDFISEKI